MGKQGFDKRTALANMLNTSGVPKAAPPKKEVERPIPVAKPQTRKKQTIPEEPVKTRKDIEEEQRKYVEENNRKKVEFYKAESSKKLLEAKSADVAVTYVEDKDSRKPKAVSDISDYWKTDLGILPFIPDDNLTNDGEFEYATDPEERIEFLRLFNDKMEQILRLRFHVFWSQFIYDEKVRRCLDTYLRYCQRAYDVNEESRAGLENNDSQAEEERNLTRQISRRVLATYVRLSRPEETETDYISDGKFAQVIYQENIFDIPKLIDLCAIYGDCNRMTVTKIVHSVFSRQPLYKDDFGFIVQHMLDGLHQCCGPLQKAANGALDSADLGVQDCLAFLPDILSCFSAIFCFFPEECVDKIVSGKLDVASATGTDCDTVSIPLANLMVHLHDALTALEKQDDFSESVVISKIMQLLCRLLGLVLGHRMAPKQGASAFEDLLEWLRFQNSMDRITLLADLGKHGLETTAMEWLASGLVDDAQLDYLESICGPVLPDGERKRGRRLANASRTTAHTNSQIGGGSTSSTTGKKDAADASTSERAKIKEIREVVGNEYGEGFVLQCLMHYGSSVPAVVGAIFDGSLPPQISALPKGRTLVEALTAVSATAGKQENNAMPLNSTISAADKSFIMGRANQQEEADDDLYDDDVDDDALPSLRVGGAPDSDSEGEGDEDDDGMDSDDSRWRDGGNNGKGKGKGKGKSKQKGDPVQGQTVQARRKEEHKARYANHNRRQGAMRKFAKGMV